ncbi:hypothetical protein X975_25874, partial [Stegodyphus mimosarum]
MEKELGSIIYSKDLENYDGLDNESRPSGRKKKKKRHSLSSSACSIEKPSKPDTPQMNHNMFVHS